MRCPECNSEKVVGGTVLSQPDYFNPGAYFRPKELRAFALTGINIGFKNRFFGCIDCGFIWARVDADKLKQVIVKKGNKSIKARLSLKEAKDDKEEKNDAGV